MEGLVSYLITFAIFVAIWSIFALGLNVHWGYTGVFNFGIAGFFMVGAYTTAVLTKEPAAGGTYSQYIGGVELPFVLGIAPAALASGPPAPPLRRAVVVPGAQDLGRRRTAFRPPSPPLRPQTVGAVLRHVHHLGDAHRG